MNRVNIVSLIGLFIFSVASVDVVGAQKGDTSSTYREISIVNDHNAKILVFFAKPFNEQAFFVRIEPKSTLTIGIVPPRSIYFVENDVNSSQKNKATISPSLKSVLIKTYDGDTCRYDPGFDIHCKY